MFREQLSQRKDWRQMDGKTLIRESMSDRKRLVGGVRPSHLDQERVDIRGGYCWLNDRDVSWGVANVCVTVNLRW